MFSHLQLQIIIAIRRKRRLDRLRHSLLPFYSFDANEEEDWDSDLLQHEGGTSTIRVRNFCLQLLDERFDQLHIILNHFNLPIDLNIFKYHIHYKSKFYKYV